MKHQKVHVQVIGFKNQTNLHYSAYMVLSEACYSSQGNDLFGGNMSTLRRFAIIDDDRQDCQIAIDALKSTFPSAHVDVFHSIKEFIAANQHYLLVIVDVQIANKSKMTNSFCPIVHLADYILKTSKYPECMEDAFGYKTICFFKKGDGSKILKAKLDLFAKQYLNQIKKVKTSMGEIEVMVDKIKYLEYLDHCVFVNCENALSFTIMNKLLKAAVGELGILVIINRNHAINPDFVYKIQDNLVYLVSGEEFKCSRNGIKNLKGILVDKLRK